MFRPSNQFDWWSECLIQIVYAWGIREFFKDMWCMRIHVKMYDRRSLLLGLAFHMMVGRLKGKSRNFEKVSLLTFTFIPHIFWWTWVCMHMNMCRQAAMNFNKLTNSSLSSTCISTQHSYSMVTIDSCLFLWSRQWSSKFQSIEKWNKLSSWVACPKMWNNFLQWNFRCEYSVMGIYSVWKSS